MGLKVRENQVGCSPYPESHATIEAQGCLAEDATAAGFWSPL